MSTPTLDQLASINPALAAQAAMGAAPPPTQPLGQGPESAPPPPMLPPEAGPPDVNLPAGPMPAMPNASPVNPVLQRHWWNLTKPAGPGQEVPRYGDAARGVEMGVPGSAAPMTKLGKLLYILNGVGTGAIAGSRQPNFASGFEASRAQNQQQQQFDVQMQAARANLGNVQTPWGMMPVSLARLILPKTLPAEIAAKSREDVADTRTQAQKDIARFNAASREKIAGVNGIEVTPEFAQQYNIPPEFVGTKIKMTDLAAMKRSSVFEDVPLQTGDGAVIVNRRTGQARRVTDANGNPVTPVSWAAPREVPDPENPGQTKFETTGQAIREGAPGMGSASLQVPREAAKRELPKDIGTQRIAFQTMLDHADLLRTAAKALNNGDTQTLNGLRNAFKTEFGWSGPITSEAIADAYKGEVSNVINKGHITDKGNEKVAHTLDPTHQNYEQLDGVLSAYQALAQSKMNNLDLQEQRAIDKSQPKKAPAVQWHQGHPYLKQKDGSWGLAAKQPDGSFKLATQ